MLMENFTHPAATDDARNGEESMADLARQISDESSRLAHLEVELAKAELAEKGREVGIGAGAFGAAGAFGICALGALTATLVLGLAQALDAWLAALIVAAALGAVAGALVLAGRSRVRAAVPPVPGRAIENTKMDIEAARRSAKEARN